MKKLTLNQAWTLCLRQWKWIIKQLDAGSKEDVNDLKRKWLEQNGITTGTIRSNCFFCEYDKRKRKSEDDYCETCPGKLVSLRFQCEDYNAYSWFDKPRKFYAKLLELNEKRKKLGKK